MLTKIPFFREVILSSFSCEECHFTDSEIQFGGRIENKGCKMTVNIKNKEVRYSYLLPGSVDCNIKMKITRFQCDFLGID